MPAKRGLDGRSRLSPFIHKWVAAMPDVAAYRRYCWPTASLDDYRVAPFHLLANESDRRAVLPGAG